MKKLIDAYRAKPTFKNAQRVRAELMERDVAYDINGRRTPRDDMAGGLESYHVPDAMGWDLQISNRTSP